MVNYRVDDLHGFLAELRAEGCQVLDQIEESEFGKFGWVMDPEGIRLSCGSHLQANDCEQAARDMEMAPEARFMRLCWCST